MATKTEDIIRLIDMRDSIWEIMEYLEGADINTFIQRIDMRESIMGQLGQIGGAAAMLTDSFMENHGEIDWEVLKGLQFSNYNEYLETDPHGVWYMVHEDFPIFLQKISDLITQYQDDEDIKGLALNKQDQMDIHDRFKNREAAKNRNQGPDVKVKDNTPVPGRKDE